MSEEVKLCPFCNGPATVGGMIPWVECQSCGASGPQKTTEAEAITAWNNRHGAGDGEDSARLDYIERTFSGMTNRERYLPVVMIWGKGANGRTLREACDKYRAKDAARAGERGVCNG